MEEFKQPKGPEGIIRWMWWLYIVVGCFIVCLLIWMFSAISENQAKYHNPDSIEYPMGDISGQ